MGKSETVARIGILVLSCDRHCDLWAPFFASFFDHWSDCSFPLYLAANEREFPSPKILTVKSGPDNDWSSSIRATLSQIKEPYVITLFEDFFLLDKVDDNEIKALCAWATTNEVRYLRFRPNPPPDESASHPGIGRIKEGALYRGSLVAALWQKDYLTSLLKAGETAWQFEVASAVRTRGERQMFCVKEDVFRFLHGVEKGLWFPDALEQMQERGYISQPQRGSWSRDKVHGRTRSAALRNVAKMALPHFLRPMAQRLVWRWYRVTDALRMAARRSRH